MDSCALCGRSATAGNKCRIPKKANYGDLYQPLRRYFSRFRCAPDARDHRVCRQQLRELFPAPEEIKLLEREKRAHCYPVELLDHVLLSNPPLACHKTCLGGLRALLRVWNNVAIHEANGAAEEADRRAAVHAASTSGQSSRHGALHAALAVEDERLDTPPSAMSFSRPSTSFSNDTGGSHPEMDSCEDRLMAEPGPLPVYPTSLAPLASAAPPRGPFPGGRSLVDRGGGVPTPLSFPPASNQLPARLEDDALLVLGSPTAGTGVGGVSSSLAFLDPLFGGPEPPSGGSDLPLQPLSPFGVVASPPSEPAKGKKRPFHRATKRRATTGSSGGHPIATAATPTPTARPASSGKNTRDIQRAMLRFISTEIWPANTFHKSRVNEFRRALYKDHGIRKPRHMEERPPHPEPLFANIETWLRQKGLYAMTHGEKEAYMVFYNRCGSDSDGGDSFISDVASDVAHLSVSEPRSSGGPVRMAAGSRSTPKSGSGGLGLGMLDGGCGGGGDLHLPALAGPDHSGGSDFSRFLEHVRIDGGASFDF